MNARTLALFIALGIFAALPAARAESVSDIVNKFEAQKAEALAAYLEANPEAKDRADALSNLIDAYTILGKNDKIADLLEQRYDAMNKGADADLGDLFGNVVQPLVLAFSQSGAKDKAMAFLEKVRTDTASHPMAGQITHYLDQLSGGLSTPGVGDTLEIAFTDIKGNKFDLAKLKGKVVLVDFWATWCGPCVQEMPNVIAAYEKYHDKGFEIVGISLDQDKSSLERFIEKENMNWAQYFDGKGWENEIAGRYGIKGIPATFLVGKKGTVIASDLRGGALEAKLAELLD